MLEQLFSTVKTDKRTSCAAIKKNTFFLWKDKNKYDNTPVMMMVIHISYIANIGLIKDHTGHFKKKLKGVFVSHIKKLGYLKKRQFRQQLVTGHWRFFVIHKHTWYRPQMTMACIQRAREKNKNVEVKAWARAYREIIQWGRRVRRVTGQEFEYCSFYIYRK